MLIRYSVAVFALAASLGASPALAQTQKADAQPTVAASGSADALYPHIYQAPLFGSLFAVSASAVSVDESALRYYASLHNIARANAEIKRLKALHPNWTPPTNIYSSAGAGADEQPFWDLLAADRLEELRAGIALKERSDPDWKPSRDLTVKIARKEAIQNLVKKSDQKKSAEALAIADADPSILHCAYMDANWRVADAFLDIGLPKRAFEIYHAIIATCPDHDERLATVRKAISRFSFDETRSLIAMGAKSADGATEFDPARIDLTRARIAAVNAGRKGETIEPDALAEFLAEASRTKDRADLGLAGWFEYNRGDYDAANRWFALAAPKSPAGADAAAINLAEGRALSLLKLGRLEDAIAVAHDWRDLSKTLRDTYVGATSTLLTRASPPPNLPDALLVDFVAFVDADRNIAGAEALGWYHYNRGEGEDAASWFKAALLWRGVDPAGAPPAKVTPEVAGVVEGYGRALARIGRLDEATRIADRWRGVGPDLEGVFVNLMSGAIDASASAAALAGEPLAHFAEIARNHQTVASAASLGWLYFRSQSYDAAIDWFRLAISWAPQGRADPAFNHGLALALKQAGRLPEAEEVAWASSKDSADMRAVYISAVVAQLADDKATLSPPRLSRFIGLVGAERSATGAQALGWRRLKDGNCGYAAPWFRKASVWSADSAEDVKTARGLALSLKAVGAYAQADDLAFAWRDRDPELRTIYVDIGVDQLTSEAPVTPMAEPRLRRFSERVLADRIVRGARALGWWRYGQASCGFGGEWLRLATAWTDADKRDVKTDEGLGLTLRATGRLAEAENIARRWIDDAPLMKKLYIDVMVEELSRDNPPEPIDEARLKNFAAVIEPIKSPLGAQALGWYRLERDEFDEAARWFKAALDWWPSQRGDLSHRLSAPVDDYQPILAKLALTHEDYRRTPRAYPNSSALIGKSREAYVNTEEGLAKTEEGYAQTLRSMGRLDEAEVIAYAWRDRWPSLRALFVDIATVALNRQDGPEIAPDRMSRYVAAITEERSSAGAAAMAFRQVRLKAPQSAVEWFTQALAWSKTEPPDPGLVEGYVAALQGAGKYTEAAEIAGKWRGASPRFELIYLQGELREMRAAGKPGDLAAAKYAEIERALVGAKSGEGALSLAWLAYEGHDYGRALVWFHNAIDWDGEANAPKAKEGVALALRALDRFDDLAAFGFAERGVSPAVRDVYYGGMVAWLTADKPVREIAPEARAHFETAVLADRSALGAQALGWGSLLRADPAAARKWFETAIGEIGFDPRLAPEKADPDRAKLIEGYVQALRGVGDLTRAEDVAFAWRDADPGLSGLYLQIVTQGMSDDGAAFNGDRLARFSAFAEAHKSAEAAAALGWRLYRDKASTDAISWFEKALAWTPQGATNPKLAEGYALSLRAVGRFADAEAYVWPYVRDSADLRAIYVSAVVSELADDKTAFPAPRLDRFVGWVAEQRSAVGSAALGWRRLKGDNCVYAAPWFRKAAKWRSDGSADADTARGLALALRKVGAFAEAGDLAYAWREREPAMRALYVDAGVEELTSEAPAFSVSEPRARRLSEEILAERNVRGARALGWWRYRQAGCGYGGDWFRLATNWGDEDKRDAKTDEGYGLTLRATGRLADSEAIARRWADNVPLMKKLYIDVMVEELSRDNPPEPLDEARLKDFASLIEPMKSPLGAQALGWYRLERNELDEAARWFKNAVDWWPQQRYDRSKRLSAPVDDYKPILSKLALAHEDYRRTPRAYPNSSSLIGKSAEDYVNTEQGYAKTLEGYAQTLRALGRLDEAETIAFAWRDRWPSLRAMFIDIAVAELDRKDGVTVTPQRLRRYVEAIEADRSSEGAAAVAWRRYRTDDFEGASDWFQKALNWSKTKPPPSGLVQGYVLALQGAKRFDAAAAAAERWRGASAELNLVYLQTELQRLRASGKPDTLSAEKYAEIEKAMQQAESADGALSLAWVAYEGRDYAHALAWFRKAESWGGDVDQRKVKEGVALSLRGLERYEELADYGYAERKTSDIVHDAYFGGMVAWLTSDKPLRAVKPEARDQFEQATSEERSILGAQALAWGALLRNDWSVSRRWFETAIDWSGFDAEDAPEKPDAAHSKLVEGYVQSLRAGGDVGRAEDIAYQWRDADAALGGLYLQIFTQALSEDGGDIADSRVARFAETAEARHLAQGAGALGWRMYRAKSYADALSWFSKAIAWSPGGRADAKINEGDALALRAAGRLVESENFAWERRAQSRELREVYVAAFSDQLLDPKLSPKLSASRLDRFGEIVKSDKISSGAAALGWRRIQDGNCGYSLGWFRKAIAWSPGGAGDGKTYAGFAQGLRAIGMFNEAEDAAYTFAERSPEARELYENVVIEELTRQWPRVPMSEIRVARFSSLVAADRSAAGAQALGWRRYMQAGCGYGGRWFELAVGWSRDSRGDAHLSEGYALTLRATGRLSRAEAVAQPWIEQAPAMKKLYIDVAVEELSRDNPPEPIPDARLAQFQMTFEGAHSALGAQALGWWRYARGENEEAARWFRNAIDWWPARNSNADQKLSAPVEDYKPLLARLALKPEDYRRTPRAYPNSSLLIGHDSESYVNTEVGFAKTVEGYVRTLFGLSRYEEAEALAFRYLQEWPPMRALVIDMAVAELAAPAADALPPERVARFVQVVSDTRSPIGAEALAWRAYRGRDLAEAARWFKSAIDWRADDGKLSVDVARAYADTLRGLKQYDEALKFVAQWRARIPDLDAVSVNIGLDSLAALDPASPEAVDRVKQIAAGVSTAQSASGAVSLGWLAYSRKEFTPAEAWFRKAILWSPAGGEPDAKALEGYARALQGERRFADFMRFSEEWGARVTQLKPLFLEAAAETFAEAAGNGEEISTDTLARAGKAFVEARSANGAQALAWQRVAAKDWVAAAAWFEAARSWSTAPEEDLKTVEGLVIALRNLHRDDEAEALAYRGAAKDDALRDLYLETVADRLTRNPPAPPDEYGMRRYVEAVVNGKSANGAQAIGWYSFNARQYPAAAAWFEKSLAFDPTENAALGLAFAYRKLADHDNFARVIQTYRANYAKIAELASGRGATREQRAAFEKPEAPVKRFRASLSEPSPARVTQAAASANGGQGAALGWSLLNQKRPAEAARAFEATLQTATGRARQDAAYGRSLALLTVGDGAGAEHAASDAPLDEKQRGEIGTQLLERRAWDSYDAERFQEALHWLDRRAAFAPEKRELMKLRVMCLQRMGRMEAASTLQAQLDQQLSK